MVLFDHDAEDVGDGFVEGAGLVVVGEGGGVFGYAVGELDGTGVSGSVFSLLVCLSFKCRLRKVGDGGSGVKGGVQKGMGYIPRGR